MTSLEEMSGCKYILRSEETSRYGDTRHFRLLPNGKMELTGAAAWVNFNAKTCGGLLSVDYDGGPLVGIGSEVEVEDGVVYRIDEIESVKKSEYVKGVMVTTFLVSQCSSGTNVDS